MKIPFTIGIEDKKTHFLLQQILHKLEDIYDTINVLGGEGEIQDISDVTEGIKNVTQQIRALARNSEE
jgi:hypothetical protein